MIQPSSLTEFVGVAPRRNRRDSIETPEQGFSSKGERKADRGILIQPNSLTGFVGAAPRRDRRDSIETPEQGSSSTGQRTIDEGFLLLLCSNLSPYPFCLSSEAQ